MIVNVNVIYKSGHAERHHVYTNTLFNGHLRQQGCDFPTGKLYGKTTFSLPPVLQHRFGFHCQVFIDIACSIDDEKQGRL